MMATPQNQEFLIKDLKTTHVILYPARAQITRTIDNVELQPGANQIEIYGLTPTTDENSVKIDGTGSSAYISDMTVDLVPNKDSFEDTYPDDSDVEFEDDDEDSYDEDELEYPAAAKALDDEIETLRLRMEHDVETDTAARNTQKFLDTYGDTLSTQHHDADTAANVINFYQSRFVEAHDVQQTARADRNIAQKEYNAKQKELRRLTREYRAEESRRAAKAAKEAAKRQREKAEKQRQKDLIKEERLKYWPKKVYRVTVHIDVLLDTPSSSRRSSITSLTTLGNDSAATKTVAPSNGISRPGPVSLVLSYVTSEARWSPRYDISFSTTTKTGSIAYTAEFHNATSETWTDAKVSLSTSQASFRGLNDEVPYMNPWHITLTKNHSSNALMNKEETQYKSQDFRGGSHAIHNRSELFGTSSPVALPRMKRLATSKQPAPGHHRAAIAATGMVHSNPRTASRATFLRDDTEGLYSAPTGQLQSEEEPDRLQSVAFSTPELQHEDTTWEDNGLTQTYELPSTRTLEPSSLTRRHKIASLSFQNLQMTSISVPKLRPAAFLRARFRNPSTFITLLKGTAGLTLDGAFLGTTTLPRMSPGESVTLPLGVDPSIQVSYSKPTVKRSTQGIFNKEVAQIFTRTIFISNTNPMPAELLVLDQVPISVDDKLRVEILQPKGLVQEGFTVSAGADAKPKPSDSTGGSGPKWGRAKATLKANGEVAWEVNLEKGGACRLGLEYEVKAPAQEGIGSM